MVEKLTTERRSDWIRKMKSIATQDNDTNAKDRV